MPKPPQCPQHTRPQMTLTDCQRRQSGQVIGTGQRVQTPRRQSRPGASKSRRERLCGHGRYCERQRRKRYLRRGRLHHTHRCRRHHPKHDRFPRVHRRLSPRHSVPCLRSHRRVHMRINRGVCQSVNPPGALPFPGEGRRRRGQGRVEPITASADGRAARTTSTATRSVHDER